MALVRIVAAHVAGVVVLAQRQVGRAQVVAVGALEAALLRVVYVHVGAQVVARRKRFGALGALEGAQLHVHISHVHLELRVAHKVHVADVAHHRLVPVLYVPPEVHLFEEQLVAVRTAQVGI